MILLTGESNVRDKNELVECCLERVAFPRGDMLMFSSFIGIVAAIVIACWLAGIQLQKLRVERETVQYCIPDVFLSRYLNVKVQ